MATPLIDRVAEKVTIVGECWVWQGHIDAAGYGRVYVKDRYSDRAHRAVYELFVGPIPEGLVIDHLCRNRACVNPGHLEPVTLKENTMRGIGLGPINIAKTHCPKGHPYDEANTRRLPTGGRRCRTCKKVENGKRGGRLGR